MEKADFINYRALVLEVRSLEDALAALEYSLGDMSSPQLSFAPKSSRAGGGSAVESRVVRYLEIKDLYAAQKAKSEAQIAGIERAIQSLESPAERQVMRFRYIEGWGWTRICMKFQSIGYSERQVFRLHGFALQKLRGFNYET